MTEKRVLLDRPSQNFESLSNQDLINIKGGFVITGAAIGIGVGIFSGSFAVGYAIGQSTKKKDNCINS